MKAVLCKQLGPPETLVLEDVPDLKPGLGEVVIDVKAAGVNFPDTLIIQGKYQFKPALPFSPGGEVAGVVKEIGPGVDTVNVGDRVIVFSGWGGFAEQVVANAAQLIPIPAGMDFVMASSFVLTYGTSHYALKDRAQLKPGESLLVLGAAGGVGVAAIELGKAMGAKKIIAAASTDEKLAFCKEHGATDVINYATEDLKDRLKTITGGDGVDVIYDPVGGAYAEPAIRSLAWGGRFLVVGFAAGDIPKIPLNLLLLKGAAALGVFWGSFVAREPLRNKEYLAELSDLFHAGKLKPAISAVYPFSQAAAGLNDILNRKVKGKVVLVPDSLA